jgi:hypothetical protein
MHVRTFSSSFSLITRFTSATQSRGRSKGQSLKIAFNASQP